MSDNDAKVPSQTTTCACYDALNRLVTAQTGTWTQTNGYDRYGNRWVQELVNLPSDNEQTPRAIEWFTQKNRINLWQYDGAGNLTGIPSMGRSFTYDGENRQTAATVNSVPAQYAYDGDGRRVQRVIGSDTTVFVYDAAGALAAEYGGTVEAGRSYVTVDHLGSTRLLTDGSGGVKKRYDYLPFGEEIPAGTGGRTVAMGYGDAASLLLPDKVSQKFTGKERDAETGLDYFGARYMASAQGRFTSPDPHNIIMEASSEEEFTSFISNPQNWNRYAYVTNNPLSITDPDGRCPLCPLFQRLAPYADKAATVAQRYGSQAVQAGQAYGRAGYLWATSFFNSPAGQQAIQTTGELATGTVIPGSPIAGVGAQTGSRILTALGSSDAAKQMEGKVAQSLANSGLLKAFDVSVAGRQIDAIAGKAGQFVVEVTTGGGRGKIGQALAQMKDTGKQVVIYGEDLSKGFVREAQKQGIKVAQNLEELKKIVDGQ